MKEWVAHIEVPAHVLSSSAVLQFAFQCLLNEDMVEEAANLCIAVLQTYVPGEASVQVLQLLAPAIINTQVRRSQRTKATAACCDII